jgi:hypothetical protein
LHRFERKEAAQGQQSGLALRRGTGLKGGTGSIKQYEWASDVRRYDLLAKRKHETVSVECF